VAAPYDRPHPPDHHYSQLRSIPIPVILTAQILTSPAIPTPSRFTSPKTQQQLSRPLENCEGCSVLAGVRNLGLDDPSAGIQIWIAISASAAAGPRRAAAARRAESLKRGCTGRTVLRAEWQVLAQCVTRGGEHAPDKPKCKCALRFSSLRDPMPRSLPALPGRQAASSLMRHTGERIGSRRWLHHGPDQVFRFVRSALGRWWR
jgi:hypothetical protein